MPPTSEWCARLTAKPTISLVDGDGRDERDVGQVRAAGVRVVQHEDVARARAAARARPRTESYIAPRWTGMCSACATMRPVSSNRAHEQSRRSLMFDE